MAAAAKAAKPKQAPWGSPARNRASTTAPKAVLNAVMRLASAKASMSAASIVRRPALTNVTSMSGAPTTTPSA